MSLVFELGYGNAVLQRDRLVAQANATGTGVDTVYVSRTVRQDFVPAGMGISFNFKIPDVKGAKFLSYIGINAMAGYRKILFNTDIRENYDGWYWSIGSAIFIDKIFSDIKKRRLSKKQ